ncbi:hypothetical protein MH117_09635 [Paenibacillus sp. ACRRX]|uniref:hypothetical protein n=1 Tax=Paenibacillus sp. ACRRX TaxID=2918206 RepID=UPI001EF48263|nr:hypothetical protein [Paenibacillus sp. ACRRX]MCG7407684.1 hypothetical protein [Paenibacillus sp. ACRRX]
MKDFQIRVIARACITRHDSGEGDIKGIVSSYKLAPTNETRVEAHVYAERPDITPDSPNAQ